MPPSILQTIRSLKDSTSEACAAISAHLKAPTTSTLTLAPKTASSSELVPASPDEAKARRHGLKPVVVELRLLGGALYSLESLIAELTSDHDSEREWPLIDECEILVTALKSYYPYATLDGIKAARSSLLDIRSKLAFVLGSSESLEEISLHFSILGSNPIPQLMTRKDDDAETTETPAQVYGEEDEEPSPEDVSGWLTVLNSPENDREPAEYNRETALVQSRRITEPAYRVAATRWPDYAEKYWRKLRPQICSLFRIQKSYSFVQWALEYARETYPRTLGSKALSPRLLLELTDALCDGSVSSLHIAAALGLPSLCRDLLSMGADVNQSSLMGTPLFCALMGTKVFATRNEPESWTTLLVGGDSNVNQAVTVLLFLDKGADCTYQYSWKNATEEVSLAGLAFWLAMISKFEDIFTRTVKGGGTLDRAFRQFLQKETVLRRGSLHKSKFARLLTYVYDLTLLDIEREGEEYHELQELVSKAMRHTNVKFAPMVDGKIETLSDNKFAGAIRTAVLDFNVKLVERLTKDPRFEPDTPYDEASGTILHMATEGAQLDIMDILIKAGANTRARDANGRTPLMVIEEVGPLAKLILEYSVPTYDTDNNGRNIWHLLAATNDVMLLQFLWERDPWKARNLDAVDQDGHTPTRSGFAYIKSLEALPKTTRPISPVAAAYLLGKCQDRPRAEEPEQLAQWAVEWGHLGLFQKILQTYPHNVEDDSLLKSLNISACPKLLSLVLDKSGPSRQFPSGITAAETVITNVKLLPNRSGFSKPTAHPSCYPAMTRSAYMELLTPEVLKSRDSRGRGIWARFCDDVLPLLSGPSAEHPSYLHFLSTFICMTISCLVHKGALVDYEKETGIWAITRIATQTDRPLKPMWRGWQFPFIAAILEALSDEDEKFSQAHITSSSREFFETSDAARLLMQAVNYRQPELAKLLVQGGINVHKPWEDLGCKTVLECFLNDRPVDVAMIRPLLCNTKPHEIIDRQHYTFREAIAISDESMSVEVVGQLIDCGMDVNSLKVTSQLEPIEPWLDSPEPSMLNFVTMHQKFAVARLLIQRGADPLLAPEHAMNPYILTVSLGYVAVLEAIVDKAPSNFDWLCTHAYPEDSDIYNALQLAAARDNRDVLITLLEATPLIDQINAVSPRHGRSPAHLAAKAGSVDCVKVLTRFGANLNVKDSSGRTPLFLAIMSGRREVIEYLKEHLLDPDNGQDLGISLLRPASPNQPPDSDMMDLSSDEAQEVKITEPRRLGVMIADAIDHYQHSRDALFRSFLDHASKDDIESAIMPCGGCTLFSYTAAKGRIRPMLELLDLGFKGFVAGCDEHWPQGFNALTNTCWNIRSLMAYDIFIPPKKAYSFFEKCLDAYLQEGRLWFHMKISPIFALFDFTTLSQAGPEHQTNVLRIFINHLRENAAAYWALMKKSGLVDTCELFHNDDIATRVLRFAMNLRSQPQTLDFGALDTTALHGLVRCCGREDPAYHNFEPYGNAAKLLIDSGADINARDRGLHTPLFLAVGHGLVPLVDMLLESGADPNILDEDGVSPLTRSVNGESLDVTRCLLKHGADPTAFSGVSFADMNGELDIFQELLEIGLDPYDCAPGLSSVLTTLIPWSPEARSYALNGNFDFYRIVEQEPSFLSKIFVERPYSPIELKAILKRLPQERLVGIVNFEQHAGVTLGCLAILGDRSDFLKLFLDAGLDIERESHDKGSALMLAASTGAFNCFKTLVSHGARLSYLGKGKRGETVVRSVVEAARLYPKLLQWLFAGRYYETRYLEMKHSEPFTAKPWSGPRKAAYSFTGCGEKHPRKRNESTVDYLVRTSRVRRSLRGKTLPVTLVD
ncbi:hypothetical protein FHETE_4922 [Fusarium heterosporum]|uniref:Ankyrin repeat protein n=1 Tax=Fusarium heterosporum TaxID=42747 RepID=A0A8H5THZ0_FUSHE|nr:hypothetical protein FHETE_4922 [Fusarium heterosporum]